MNAAFTVHNEDCLTGMANLAENSIDAIVTDPPYHLTTGKKGGSGPASHNPNSPAGRARISTGFMGKAWDGGDIAFRPELWQAALRIAKPGAHLLAFGGTRTFHRLTCAIEDAGWEVRDCLMWVYGSGFPKSLDVSKAIDKAVGAERERIPGNASGGMKSMNAGNCERGYRDDAYYDNGNSLISNDPITDIARQWSGWGTALKPAWEPIILARKPLTGTVADNAQEWGTGALNIDGCRIATDSAIDDPRLGGNGAWRTDKTAQNVYEGGYAGDDIASSPLGRWPANLIHDGSEEVLGLFPQSKSTAQVRRNGAFKSVAKGAESARESFGFSDSGSAARFFYCAKASKADRDEGLDGFEAKSWKDAQGYRDNESTHLSPRAGSGRTSASRNTHPTVKPTTLMRYLCRLITPPGGIVLDPFTGSGSTGKAALLEGFRFIGFELEAEYAAIARARCQSVGRSQPLLTGASA